MRCWPAEELEAGIDMMKLLYGACDTFDESKLKEKLLALAEETPVLTGSTDPECRGESSPISSRRRRKQGGSRCVFLLPEVRCHSL